MKKNTLILTALTLTAVFTACQEKLENTNDGPMVSVKFSAGADDSRTDISSTGAVTWNANDHLAVFTDVDGSSVYDFGVSALNQEKTVAEFSGTVPSNPSRTEAYALYPYKNSYTGGPDAVVVGVNSQQTSGMNYTFMAGKGAVDGDNFDGVSMSMKHLTWIYDVHITNPDAKAIKYVYFAAGSGVFTWNGTVDLTADDPVVTPNNLRKTMSVVFNTARTTDVTARFTLFPLSCTDVDFNIYVVFEDGFYETFALGTRSLNVAAGVRKSNTFVLGNGTASQAPWGWYYVVSGSKINDNTVISAAKNVLGGNGADVKLYLEPGGTFSTTGRINPTATFMIDSDPANKPTLTQGGAALFTPKTDNSNIETLSIKNVNLVASSSLSSSYLLWTSDETSAAITIGSIELDNCSFRDYKNALVMTKISGSSSRTTSVTIESITLNNCTYKAKASYDGALALLHLGNSGNPKDKVNAVTFTNNTIQDIGAFLYLAEDSTTQGGDSFTLTVENNTFANMKACSTNGLFDIQNSIKGTASVQKNLFVGSNANTGTRRIMREGAPSKFNNTFDNNWYTADWLTFTPDASSSTFINFLTDESSLSSAALCPGYASGNFTVSASSDVKAAGAGDPRWL